MDALQRINDDDLGSGSTMAEVRAILGEPDDVITEEDENLLPGYANWCYGTAGHLTLPTLGCVMFDGSGRARDIRGAAPVAPAVDLPSEAELRDLLRFVDRVRVEYTRPADFNPRDMVAVVNRLRRLGKQKALVILREYSRVQSTAGLDDGAGAIILMRFLFSAPVGETHPTTYLPFEECKSAAYPAFPAIVIEGVPLYLFPLGGWGMGGGLPKVDEYLKWYEKHGVIIEKPLRPTDDPRLVWKAWQEGPRNILQQSDPSHAEAADDLILAQLLRMVDTVHARQFDEDTLHFANKQDLWAGAIATLQETPSRWDKEAECYVRARDGAFIEPKQEKKYARVIWKLPLEGRRTRLVLHRISETTVDVDISQITKNATPLPTMKVRIFAKDNPQIEIVSEDVDGDFTFGSQSSADRFDLVKGVELRAQLIRDGQIIAESPVMNIDRDVGRGK